MAVQFEKPIALGADHGGYELKEAIKQHLEERGIAYRDFGTNSTASCDYPDYAAATCGAVTNGSSDFAILCCGTGVGMSMCANNQCAAAQLLGINRNTLRKKLQEHGMLPARGTSRKFKEK